MKNINKIRTAVLSFIFLIPTLVIAQKTKSHDIGKYYWTQLPSNPLPKEYKTYKVDASSFNEYRADKIRNGIKVEGFKKLEEAESDFKVRAKEYEMLFSEGERKRSEHTKKVDGVEKKYYTYDYHFKVTHKLKVTVYNKDSEKLFSREFTNSGEKFTGGSSESSKTAWEKFKNKKAELKSKLLSDKLGSARRYLNSIIGFPKVSVYVTLYTGKTKRKSKFDYEDYDTALDIAREGVEILRKDENDFSAAKKKFNIAFEIWEKALMDSEPENKKARVNEKVTAMTHFNMLVCNFLLKEYDKALQNIENIKTVKKRFSTSDVLKGTILDTKKRVEANI